MGKNSKIITLTKSVWTRRKRRVGRVICHKCRIPLWVGSQIFSRSATLRWPGSARKYYCLDCAEELGFIPGETQPAEVN